MDILFVLLHYLEVEILFPPIAVATLFLPVQPLKKPHLGVELLYYPLLLLDFILEGINLLPIEELETMTKLLKFFAENAVLLDLVIEFLPGELAAGIRDFGLFLGPLLHLHKDLIEVFVELTELGLDGLVLTFLFLDKFQPHLMTQYISEIRFWYFFMMRCTPSFESISESPTTI